MKDQYLFLVFAFSFMAAYRLTIGFNLRALLQMTLFAVPLAALIAEGEEAVSGWAYVCLAVAVTWWFADLYLVFREARIVYQGKQRYRVSQKSPLAPASAATRKTAKPTAQPTRSDRSVQAKTSAPEKVELVSIQPADIEYGPVIGLVEDRPIYEWIAARGRDGRAHYMGILGRGTDIEDNDLMLAPGLVYRWTQHNVRLQDNAELETV